MNRYNIKYILPLFVVLFSYTGELFSQSIFGSTGIGEMKYFINGRTVGMGGAGLALKDNLGHNNLNSSAWADIDYTGISVGLIGEGVKRGDEAETFGRKAALNSFILSSKIGKNITFGGGLAPYTDIDYNLETSAPGRKQSVEGRGGLSESFFVAAYKYKMLSVGFKIKHIMAKNTEVWFTSFDNSDYEAVINAVDYKIGGNSLDFGVTLEPISTLRIAAVYNSSNDLNVVRTVHYTPSFSESSSFDDYGLPSSFGVGTAYKITDDITFAADYYMWNMSKLLTDDVNASYNDSYRISAGVEFLGGRGLGFSVAEKLDFRFGGYLWDLYPKNLSGEKVQEKFLTLGVGWFFNDQDALGTILPTSPARIDLGLEFGIRSEVNSTLGNEKIARLSITLTKGETWFRKLYGK